MDNEFKYEDEFIIDDNIIIKIENEKEKKKNKKNKIDFDVIIIDEEEEKINIVNIPNIYYVGDIIHKNTDSKCKWKLEYKCDKNIQNKKNGRIYLIIVDGIIYKIGSSEAKGGIKGTFTPYEGGLGGSPSIRTFGIHKLIQEQLDLGKKIQIYVLFIEEIKTTIIGLTTNSMEIITYPQIKIMEDLCREDYKKIYGKYPRWNFQENVEEWPEHIKEAYKQQVNNR